MDSPALPSLGTPARLAVGIVSAGRVGVALGVALEPDRHERGDRREEAEGQSPDRPAPVDRDGDRHEHVGDEDDPVEHPEDADPELGRAGDVLEHHADDEEEPRDRLGGGDGSEGGARGGERHAVIVVDCRADPSCGGTSPNSPRAGMQQG